MTNESKENVDNLLEDSAEPPAGRKENTLPTNPDRQNSVTSQFDLTFFGQMHSQPVPQKQQAINPKDTNNQNQRTFDTQKQGLSRRQDNYTNVYSDAQQAEF
jgi:hypothetical protein